MKQVLAVAVAASLIALAIVVRDTLDDDGGSVADGPADDGSLVVACVTELRDACEAMGIDVRIEDPADTLADAAVDAWVTFEPWPAMAELGAGEAVFTDPAVAVASSEIVLLARTDALPAGCRPTPDWDCVAEVTGSGAPALPSPGGALGPLVLGHAALSWSTTTRPGEPFAANEFELPEFQGWLRALAFSRDPVLDMLQLGAAGPVATGTTRATLDSIVQPSPRAVDLDAVPTQPAASIAVVVVGRAAQSVVDDTNLLDGLEALGWHLDPEAVTTGLPNAGVLVALQEIA